MDEKKLKSGVRSKINECFGVLGRDFEMIAEEIIALCRSAYGQEAQEFRSELDICKKILVGCVTIGRDQHMRALKAEAELAALKGTPGGREGDGE